MNFEPNIEAGLAEKFVSGLTRLANDVEIVLCPSHVGLHQVNQFIKKSNLVLGAQNMSWVRQGAFTGEISAEMLDDVGAKYCIIGHSDRRIKLGETDKMVNQKVLCALVDDVLPIICVGETYNERSEGKKEIVVQRQLEAALKNVSGQKPIVITYEPVWAISPGGPAMPDDIQPMIELIYQSLIDYFPLELVEENFRIIYGGSVDGSNVSGFLELDKVSGALVGAASLSYDKFKTIIEQAKKNTC